MPRSNAGRIVEGELVQTPDGYWKEITPADRARQAKAKRRMETHPDIFESIASRYAGGDKDLESVAISIRGEFPGWKVKMATVYRFVGDAFLALGDFRKHATTRTHRGEGTGEADLPLSLRGR